jgi:hypothetical protein
MKYWTYTLIWKNDQSGQEVWQSFAAPYRDARGGLTAILNSDEAKLHSALRLHSFSGPHGEIIVLSEHLK